MNQLGKGSKDVVAATRLADLDVRLLPAGPAASIFTVDVEDWYHANFRSIPTPDGAGLPQRVEVGVDRLLALLDETGTTATFFVLGCVARDHPTLVERIAAAGHEIACHAMDHTLVYEQSIADFKRSTGDARKLLCDQSGQPVLGFRSPSWSLTERSLWAFEALSECGFRYDSSVFPVSNYLYGIGTSPTGLYAVRTAAGAEIIEVPPSVLRFGRWRIGVGGGFYLRVLPLWVQRRALRAYMRRGSPFLTYVHPREFDPGAWPLRLPLSFAEQLIHRIGIGVVHRRVDELLRSETWCSVEQMLCERGLLEGSV